LNEPLVLIRHILPAKIDKSQGHSLVPLFSWAMMNWIALLQCYMPLSAGVKYHFR